MLREIYAFIHSQILYGVEIYVNTNTYLDKLMKLNNKLRTIL